MTTSELDLSLPPTAIAPDAVVPRPGGSGRGTGPEGPLVDGAWVLAALARRLTRPAPARPDPLEDAVEGVLRAAGLAARADDEHALTRGRALRSQLAQVLALADPTTCGEWAQHDDGTLLAQGRASGALAAVLTSARTAPRALVERLAAPGARFLDVGTGVGAICAQLCVRLPGLSATAIDVLPRVLRLAAAELAAAGVADRVELREQDVRDLDETGAYDVVWVPLPLLEQPLVAVAVRNAVRALRPGGWLIVPVGPDHEPGLQRELARLRAAAVGGNPGARRDVEPLLREAGLDEVHELVTPRGGPTVVAARAGGAR